MMRRERAAGINSGPHYTVLIFFCILYLLCRILRIFQLYGPVSDGARLQRYGLRNHHQPDISGKSSDGAGGRLYHGHISSDKAVSSSAYRNDLSAVYFLYKIYGPALAHASGDGPVCRDRLPFQQLMDAWVNISREKTAGSDLQPGFVPAVPSGMR